MTDFPAGCTKQFLSGGTSGVGTFGRPVVGGPSSGELCTVCDSRIYFISGVLSFGFRFSARLITIKVTWNGSNLFSQITVQFHQDTCLQDLQISFLSKAIQMFEVIFFPSPFNFKSVLEMSKKDL